MKKQLTLLETKSKKSKRKEKPQKKIFSKKGGKRRLKSVKDLLYAWKFDDERIKSQKFLKHEFQDYGVRLAHNLNDLEHKSLYIKLAKTDKRLNLEQAYRFCIDYPNMEGKNKGKLFMWALAKLRRGEELSNEKDKDK